MCCRGIKSIVGANAEDSVNDKRSKLRLARQGRVTEERGNPQPPTRLVAKAKASSFESQYERRQANRAEEAKN